MSTENKYFLIDYGKDVKEYAELMKRTLEKKKCHIMYIHTNRVRQFLRCRRTNRRRIFKLL